MQKHVKGSDATGHLNMRHLHSSENAQQPLTLFFGEATICSIVPNDAIDSLWRIVAVTKRNHTEAYLDFSELKIDFNGSGTEK